MDFSLDLSEITKELQEIKSALKDNITKKDLDNALKAVVKQSDIETMVINIVNELLISFKKEIKKEVDDQISKILDKQNKEIEKLKEDLDKNITRLNKKCIDQYLKTNKQDILMKSATKRMKQCEWPTVMNNIRENLI